MSSSNRSREQRHHVRYQLKEKFSVGIQGGSFDGLAGVVDLNCYGIGFSAVSEGRELVGKFITLDLISHQNQVMLKSLSARVVFVGETIPFEKDTAAETANRYGVKFVNLSALQKRQLDIITKKYTLAESNNTLSF